MSFSDEFSACMTKKSMPTPSELFSGKKLHEAVDIVEEIYDALEAAGGVEITLAALATLGPTLGISEDGLKVLGLLAGAGAQVSASVYLSSAFACLAWAVAKDGLLSELEQIPDGYVKDQVQLGVDDAKTAIG